jgi:hypothetical protein
MVVVCDCVNTGLKFLDTEIGENYRKSLLPSFCAYKMGLIYVKIVDAKKFVEHYGSVLLTGKDSVSSNLKAVSKLRDGFVPFLDLGLKSDAEVPSELYRVFLFYPKIDEQLKDMGLRRVRK